MIRGARSYQKPNFQTTKVPFSVQKQEPAKSYPGILQKWRHLQKEVYLYLGTGSSCTGSSPSVNDILFQGYMKLFLCSEGKRRNKGTILATRYALPGDNTEPFLFQDSRNSFRLEVMWANGLCTSLLGVNLSLLWIGRPISSWLPLCILNFLIRKMGITILASPPHNGFCDWIINAPQVLSNQKEPY